MMHMAVAFQHTRHGGYVGKEYNSMLRSANHLRTILGREASESEIAVHMGKTPARIQALLSATVQTESADTTLHDDGDFTLYDVTEDVGAELPGDQRQKRAGSGTLALWSSKPWGSMDTGCFEKTAFLDGCRSYLS